MVAWSEFFTKALKVLSGVLLFLLQFERGESAMKALIDLDGRFFGGRTVNAMFFPEERLDKQDLAPRPGQGD